MLEIIRILGAKKAFMYETDVHSNIQKVSSLEGVGSMITNTNVRIHLSLQPDVVDLLYFTQLSYVELYSKNFKYQRFTSSGCKDVGLNL